MTVEFKLYGLLWLIVKEGVSHRGKSNRKTIRMKTRDLEVQVSES